MFLPTTINEIKKLGWSQLDIILVSGDTYIDSPFNGLVVIGKILLDKGYKVGIIAQPDINSNEDISRLGEPKLFWGISSGCVDSMVANYTPLLKKRKSDDFTPSGINNKRPDRALIAYTNLIRRSFKNTVPIVLGGIEASLRRIAHYDYWSDSLRRSILFDSKADFLLYGMSENSIVELAEAIRNGDDYSRIRGLCYISKEPKNNYLNLPVYEEVVKDKDLFVKMFDVFYQNNDPLNATGIQQKHNDRFLIQNPPSYYLSQKELDYIYNLPFEKDIHPFYKKMGNVKALDTIKFSVISHFGCYGECNFCAIAVHQGRTIRSRSISSIKGEVDLLTKQKDFKGYVSDIGGPTANMYGYDCEIKTKKGACKHKRCLYPNVCNQMRINHSHSLELLNEIKKNKLIKKIFVASGIRFDMIFNDKKTGLDYMENLVKNHVSGQLKIAPEHIDDKILALMGKPKNNYLLKFRELFYQYSKKHNLNQFLTYYFIAAHPGCKQNDMLELKKYISENLKMNPEQIQIFTPTPSTYSSVMYYTNKNPFTNEQLFVEKNNSKKDLQKSIITNSENRRKN